MSKNRQHDDAGLLAPSTSSQEITPAQTPPPSPPAANIAQALQTAIERGMDAASIEKIVMLYERMTARHAAEEFAAALARFQQRCPPVPKNARASVVSRTGSSYAYTYATLDQIAEHVRPYLASEGLSYTWDMVEDGSAITCTCTLRHANGHSVSASFRTSTETPAPLTGPQKIASALTYARRQSLVQVLGLTTCDADDDAAGARDETTISEHQIANLRAALEEVHGDEAAFCRYLGVGRLADIPASRLKEAFAAIEAKRRAMA